MTAHPAFPLTGDTASVRLVFFTDTVPPHDASLDVSDYWAEELDPENEVGLLVHATFDRTEKHHDGHDYAEHALTGLTVEDTDRIVFIDRAGALTIFGEGRVCDFEDEMDTTSNWTPDDGSDAAYENWRDAG